MSEPVPSTPAVEASLWLAAIVESSDDAIVSKDLNGIVLTWNRAAERIFGYTADEIVGTSIRRIIPDDRQAEEDATLAAIRRGDTVHHFETLRRRKSGELIPISLAVSPIRGTNGEIVGASKIARDISALKEAEHERARLLERAVAVTAALNEASRLKDDFLASLSHELRTPLNAILGYARLVRSGIIGPDRLEKAVETIERNANALAQIVEDVLDVSRIISGKLRLNIQTVDLPDVVEAAIDAVRPAADAKGVRIERVIDPDVSPISGDPDRLQQVLWNLFSNAVKFTATGGRVRVCLEREDSHLQITVSDTGIGISPEFLPHIFERFRQAEGGTAREQGGLGLGLAIARQLVEMHGGTIAADSAGAGAGATFRVRLPIASVRPVSEEHPRVQTRPTRAAPEMAAQDLSGIHVLVVDDERDALALAVDVLHAAGATVATASSAAEALQAIDTVVPDVLIADLGMPIVDGFGLIERIRRHHDDLVQRLPAAALTAYVRSDDRVKALRAGFDTHLAKPIEPAELRAAVASLARRASDSRPA